MHFRPKAGYSASCNLGDSLPWTYSFSSSLSFSFPASSGKGSIPNTVASDRKSNGTLSGVHSSSGYSHMWFCSLSCGFWVYFKVTLASGCFKSKRMNHFLTQMLWRRFSLPRWSRLSARFFGSTSPTTNCWLGFSKKFTQPSAMGTRTFGSSCSILLGLRPNTFTCEISRKKLRTPAGWKPSRKQKNSGNWYFAMWLYTHLKEMFCSKAPESTMREKRTISILSFHIAEERQMSNQPPNNRPTTRPLTEGYVVKGGHNPSTSQIQTRPAAPAPIPAPKPVPSPQPTSERNNGRG